MKELRPPSRLHLLLAATSAEKAWMQEVVAQFGAKSASMLRYQERATGDAGTKLRALYDEYVAARDVYQAS